MKQCSYNYETLESVFTHNKMSEGFRLCKLGKLWKDSVYEFSLNENLFITDIMDKVLGHRYYFSDFKHPIIIERGKERLLSTVTIDDRLVYKVMNNYFLLKYYRPRLIRENCATLKNRGQHDAIDILKRNLQSMTYTHGLDYYILKMDIKSYFDNISHDYCMGLVEKATYDDGLIKLFEIFFKRNFYDDKIHNGERVPYGIGLGGEIPQTFGIIVLNDFDHMLKEKFGVKMVRYMDDIIIVHEDKDYLKEVLSESTEYINTTLHLDFNKNKTYIVPAKKGIKFLKMHFYPRENTKIDIHSSKKSRHNERRKLLKYRDMLDKGEIDIESIHSHYMSHRAYENISTNKELLYLYDEFYNETFVDFYVENGYFDF